MAHPVLAQALIEKGLLDSAATGVSSFFIHAVDALQTRPYLLIVLGIVLMFLLKPKR